MLHRAIGFRQPGASGRATIDITAPAGNAATSLSNVNRGLANRAGGVGNNNLGNDGNNATATPWRASLLGGLRDGFMRSYSTRFRRLTCELSVVVVVPLLLWAVSLFISSSRQRDLRVTRIYL